MTYLNPNGEEQEETLLLKKKMQCFRHVGQEWVCIVKIKNMLGQSGHMVKIITKKALKHYDSTAH